MTIPYIMNFFARFNLSKFREFITKTQNKNNFIAKIYS